MRMQTRDSVVTKPPGLNIPPTRAQIWQLRAQRGLLGQCFPRRSDLHAAFLAHDYADRPLSAVLPGTASEDCFDSTMISRVEESNTLHPDSQIISTSSNLPTQDVSQTFARTAASPYDRYQSTSLDSRAGKSEVDSPACTPSIKKASASPEHDAVPHEQCDCDSCASPLFHNRHPVRSGSLWRLGDSPSPKLVVHVVSDSVEAQPIVKAGGVGNDIQSDGASSARKNIRHMFDSLKYTERVKPGLTSVVLELRRGIHSAGRRGSVVVAGMRSRARLLSSVGRRR
ncbi:uncharacterized protein K460DRAFT_45362 [Cucurbitaria berberidis CBS 394.84]|uniref:Uncharacterized protein n=1 Tax=Cucurbitaria berberidis CBS 394.84 TaxID=1168544 RepID=A0A9P4GUY7_9PLEO|nr:uncharacterized protein K460DRAFT_45362 [Cucurbitaria berberidis CBS 394.84]KAF1852014.1 hypothetical protein K460DRAFT_45362 [Cucurbitaria berberidis CBS 394.84]